MPFLSKYTISDLEPTKPYHVETLVQCENALFHLKLQCGTHRHGWGEIYNTMFTFWWGEIFIANILNNKILEFEICGGYKEINIHENTKNPSKLSPSIDMGKHVLELGSFNLQQEEKEEYVKRSFQQLENIGIHITEKELNKLLPLMFSHTH